MGYSQAVRHQTLTLAFSLVRIQLSQPKRGALQRRASLFGWDTNAKQAFAKQTRWFAFPPKDVWELAHKRLGVEYSPKANVQRYMD